MKQQSSNVQQNGIGGKKNDEITYINKYYVVKCSKWDCKERKGKLYYRGIIQAPKAVNKTPSWKGDRVYFEDNGYEVGMLRKTKDILNNAGAIQDGKYKKVLVKPHKKTGGILVSLYWLVSEDIIRRMTENCSVQVNNTIDKETYTLDHG